MEYSRVNPYEKAPYKKRKAVQDPKDGDGNRSPGKFESEEEKED